MGRLSLVTLHRSGLANWILLPKEAVPRSICLVDAVLLHFWTLDPGPCWVFEVDTAYLLVHTVMWLVRPGVGSLRATPERQTAVAYS